MTAIKELMLNQGPLVDDPGVREIFSDNLAGVSFTQGNLSIVFAVIRPDHNKPGNPSVRHVTGRIAMPITTASVLHENLGRILKELESQGVIRKAPTLGVVQ
jgi:hypothetical protein